MMLQDPSERITLPGKTGKRPAAEICLYHTHDGWTHSLAYKWEDGNGCYPAGTCHVGYCPTRFETLDIACKRLIFVSYPDTPEWIRIRAWAERLQFDLFGEADA